MLQAIFLQGNVFRFKRDLFPLSCDQSSDDDVDQPDKAADVWEAGQDK